MGASVSVVGKRLAHKLGIWKRASKVKVKQGDGSSQGGNLVVNTSWKVMDCSSVLSKFAKDAEVMYSGNWDIILGLSWLTENGFSVDPWDKCLRNVNRRQVMPCSVRWILEVVIMEEESLADSIILLIIDRRERYSRYAQCCHAKQAARLAEHKCWDHQIPLLDPNVKIPTGAICKPTQKEDEALGKYLQQNIPTQKV